MRQLLRLLFSKTVVAVRLGGNVIRIVSTRLGGSSSSPPKAGGAPLRFGGFGGDIPPFIAASGVLPSGVFFMEFQPATCARFTHFFFRSHFIATTREATPTSADKM